MSSENTKTPSCEPTAIYFAASLLAHLVVTGHSQREMSELRGLHGSVQQRGLGEAMQHALSQIHDGQRVLSVHHGHQMSGECGDQRDAEVQNLPTADRHRVQRRGGERSRHAQTRQIGQRNALARNADVEIEKGGAVGEEEPLELGAEDGAADGGLAETAVGEREIGSETDELIAGIESEGPADSEVLRVESDELDLADGSLVVLRVRRRERGGDETAVDVGFVGEKELDVEEGHGIADGVGDRVEHAQISVGSDQQIATIQRENAVRLQIAEVAAMKRSRSEYVEQKMLTAV